MTALSLRPALADVLAALTDEPRGHWIARFADPSLRGELLFVRARPDRLDVVLHYAVDRHRAPVRDVRTTITVSSPAEAFEALISRGVLPDAWAGDDRRAFVCEACRGRGVVMRSGRAGPTPAACSRCAGGCLSHPATIPALVAWASLGPVAILRAEELARERVRQWWRQYPKSDRLPRLVDACRIVWTVHRMGGDPLEDTGVLIDDVSPDAITIVVPPVGAP